MPDYIPNALPKFTDWVQLQQRKRPQYAAVLGWDAAEVQRRDAADAAVLQAVRAAEDAQTAARAALTARDQAVRDYETATRTAVARDKTHPAYTEAIGQDCQWLTPADDPDRTALQPSLRASASAEGIRLDWSKNGQDGVQVYRRAAGEAAWGRPLAFDSRSPYIDTETGLSGVYEYYVQLMHDDAPVGQPSDIVTALHGGR